MQIVIRIPPELHDAIPKEQSVSGLVRQLLSSAAEHPETLVSAFSTLGALNAERSASKRYAIYMPDGEWARAGLLAEKYLLSLNQVTQVLLEDLLYRAGRWPKGGIIDSPAEKD